MPIRGGGRVCFRPYSDEDKAAIAHKRKPSKSDGNNSRGFGGNWRLRLPKRSELSPVSILKHLGDKMAIALHLVSRKRASPLESSSSSGRSKPLVAPVVDSQRAEAIDDCIKFINSSALQRSNSVSANPR